MVHHNQHVLLYFCKAIVAYLQPNHTSRIRLFVYIESYKWLVLTWGVLEIKGFWITYFANMQYNINWMCFYIDDITKNKSCWLILCAFQWSRHVSSAVAMVITAFVMLRSVYDRKTCLAYFCTTPPPPDYIVFIIYV